MGSTSVRMSLCVLFLVGCRGQLTTPESNPPIGAQNPRSSTFEKSHETIDANVSRSGAREESSRWWDWEERDFPSDPGDTPIDPDDGDDPGDTGGDDPGDVNEPRDDVARGTIEVAVEQVTSSTIALSWPAVSGAVNLRIYAGPEPASRDGLMPVETLLAELPAGDTSHVISGIAAATDLFVRVEAEMDDGSAEQGFAHGRTIGGPRAHLDTPLREVHAYGPNVLMVVLENKGPEYVSGRMNGNLGGAWQGGSWQIERLDGTSIRVNAVHRHSIPISQPNYPVGFEQWGDGDFVDIDHRVFLVLDEAIGSAEMLRVRHSGDSATALDVLVPFSDKYLETPLVQVNQVGYNPQASKRWAYVYGYMGSGGAVDLSSLSGTADVLVEPLDPLAPRLAEYAELPIEGRSDYCGLAGAEVRQIDLSGVAPAEGVRLRVHIPGVGVSWPTAVSNEAAARAFYVVWRGLFHNRWCGDLTPETTEWSRPADHCSAFFVSTGKSGTDGMFGSSTPKTNERPLRGGHHDAGDFDIRPYHVVVAQYLLRAYEMAPERFTDGQLSIVESGNGIPDVLDEALWSVAAWQQLQNEDGGVRSGVESHRHPAGVYYADQDRLPYWTYDPVAWHTAYTAGLMAQAGYLVEPFDAARSAELRGDAISAYEWARSHGAPEEYLLYAAGEIFRLTGEARFKSDYESLWNAVGKWGRGAFDNMQPQPKIYPGAFTGYTPAMADFVMGYADADGARADIVETTMSELTGRANGMRDGVLHSGWGHRHGRRGSTPPDWGHDVSTGRHVDMVFQRMQLGQLDGATKQSYIDAMSISADYVLGCNPAGYSYITGLGSRSPQEPLHLDSLAFAKDKGMPPVPGIPTYGPVSGFPGSYYYRPVGAAYYPAFNDTPVGHHYTDARTAVNMSEFSVWEMQAPLAELFAALLPPDIDAPPASWLPGGSEHRSTLAPHFAE